MINFSQQKQFAQFRQNFRPSQSKQQQQSSLPQQVKPNKNGQTMSGQHANGNVESNRGYEGRNGNNMTGMNDELKYLRNQLNRFTQKEEAEVKSGRQNMVGQGRFKNSLSTGQLLPYQTRRPQQSSTRPIDQNTPKVVPIVNPNKHHTTHQAIFPSETVKSLKEQLNQRQHEIRTLKEEVNGLKIQRQSLRGELQKKEEEMRQVRRQVQEMEGRGREDRRRSQTQFRVKMESEKLQYQATIKTLQQELSTARSALQSKTVKNQPPSSLSFDQSLKTHLSLSDQLRQSLYQKTIQLSTLQTKQQQYKTLISSLRQQLTVQQLKLSTQTKNIHKKAQITINKLQQQIQSMNKRIEAVQMRWKRAQRQIQAKDQFIMQYMVNRGHQKQQKDIKEIIMQFRKVLQQRWRQEGMTWSGSNADDGTIQM